MQRTRRGARVVAALAAAALLAIVGVNIWARTADPPAGLGLTDGRLAPCPDRPNCVSSETDPTLPPIPFRGDATATRARLVSVVSAMPGARLRVDEPGYVAFEFSSRILGFV
ncbi:MAG: DUF1499 domain-containing protein, partial [Planctomycetota bacterium]